MRYILLLATLLAGCVAIPEGREPGARILVMGDSVIAWNRGEGASIADVTERRLGEPVLDASVPGARMRQGGLRGAVGLSIPAQYRAGDWDTVILNGGANDLRATCGCARCDGVLDRLAQQDYPDLIARLAPARVVIVGYYGRMRGGGGSFDDCDDELLDLGNRLAALAARDARVTFVPVRAAVAGDPRYYGPDRVHPSPEGSALIGGLVARAVSR
jgi:lysophospholipase L1-like esterase